MTTEFGWARLRVPLFAVIAFGLAASANPLGIKLTDSASKGEYFFIMNPDPLSVDAAKGTTGRAALPIAEYRVANRRVETGGTTLAQAEEILYQTRVAGLDVLIVRVEWNSFSNPLRWLLALAGHPVQMSRIDALVIRGGSVVGKKELCRKASAYAWKAEVFLEGPPRGESR